MGIEASNAVIKQLMDIWNRGRSDHVLVSRNLIASTVEDLRSHTLTLEMIQQAIVKAEKVDQARAYIVGPGGVSMHASYTDLWNILQALRNRV